MVGRLIMQRVELKKQRDNLALQKKSYIQWLNRIVTALEDMAPEFRPFGEDEEGRPCFVVAREQIVYYPDYDSISELIAAIRDNEKAIENVDEQLDALGIYLDPAEEGPTWQDVQPEEPDKFNSLPGVPARKTDRPPPPERTDE